MKSQDIKLETLGILLQAHPGAKFYLTFEGGMYHGHFQRPGKARFTGGTGITTEEAILNTLEAVRPGDASGVLHG